MCLCIAGRYVASFPPLRFEHCDWFKRERERDCEPLGQRINWFRACRKKKYTVRRDLRSIVFQGMWRALFWIPHKPEHLHINTSLSTKSSLVGLYSFQGNLQSGGDRLSWGAQRENETKCRKTWKWFNCFILPLAVDENCGNTKHYVTLKMLVYLVSHTLFCIAFTCYKRSNCTSFSLSCRKHAYAI